MPTRRLALGLPLLVLAAPSQAQPGPAQLVERWHAALLAAMRDARRLGIRGRFERLSGPMREAFDLAAMTRIAVGPPWTTFPPAEQQALVEAFSRWSIATYASRFDNFSGESFATLGAQPLPNGDMMVRTVLNRPTDEPVELAYLLRGNPGAQRIVDIYLTGSISELASRRSEFSRVLRTGGAARLTQELEQRSTALLAG